MPFKINIATKDGKTFRLEVESEVLIGKKIGDVIKGAEISADLAGYELKITGASDIAGFPHKGDVEGPQLKRVLLKKGWGMHKKPKKEGKKPVSTPKGLRLKKSVRGKELSEKTVQINLTIEKPGSKTLDSVFPDQNKKEEVAQEASKEPREQASSETKSDNEPTTEEIKEEIKEEVKEEVHDSIPESPETKSEKDKEKAAEEVAEQVAEESQEVAEKIAEEEKKE